MSILDNMKPEGFRARDEKIALAELRRVLALPVIDRLDSPAHIEAASKAFMSASALKAGARLLPAQANAIVQFAMRSKAGKPGLFAPMGVGQGKTLTTLACAAISLSPDAFAPTKGAPRMRRAMLIIPPNLHPQLTRQDIKWARTMMSLPFRVFDLTSSKRKEIAAEKADGLYLMTYSRLSCADAEEIINLVDPDIIICDEAHNLKNRMAARTKRFLRLLRSRERAFVCLSGTMTSRSLLDYHHLSLYSLKDDSPLPRDWDEIQFWNAAMASQQKAVGFDPTAIALTRRDIELFSPLVNWSAARDPQAFRRGPDEAPMQDTDFIRTAYNIRRRCSPGVVDSSDQDIGTSLVYDRIMQGFAETSEIRRMQDELDAMWVAPNGDEIECALTKFKWHSELTVGYYNDLRWPEGHPHLEQAKELHAAAQLYHKALRGFFIHRSQPGLDTPMLVGDHFKRHGGKLDPELYDLWKVWHDLRIRGEKEGWPERYAVPVRVDDAKIRCAARTALDWDKSEAGVLWVYHQEVGKWLVETLRESDRRVVHAPAGADKVILDPQNQTPGTIVVASIAAHGTGKNLQSLRHNLFVEGFPSAVTAEQAVGRSHRTGQTADELTMQILMGTSHDSTRLAACLNDAVYIHTTMGRQKLIYGSWAFQPEIFSAASLKERGAAVNQLTADQFTVLKEKFN